MSKISVSIIIPAYNAASKIVQALTSIKAQTFTDYEVIIVNDASTDNTEQTARDFLEKANINFQIINHDKNLGGSAARNTGIKAAGGGGGIYALLTLMIFLTQIFCQSYMIKQRKKMLI